MEKMRSIPLLISTMNRLISKKTRYINSSKKNKKFKIYNSKKILLFLKKLSRIMISMKLINNIQLLSSKKKQFKIQKVKEGLKKLLIKLMRNLKI